MKARHALLCLLISVMMSPGSQAASPDFERPVIIAAAESTPPVPAIDGPTEARTGDIIILDASASIGDHFSWYIDSSDIAIPQSRVHEDTERLIKQLRGLGVKVEEPAQNDKAVTHLILDGGRRVVLASYPGKWKIIFAVSNAAGIKQVAWRVVITPSGDEPSPPTNPPTNPPGNPDPPVIPQFGLKVSVSEWKAAVPASSRLQAPAVASSIEQVASAAIAGRIVSLAEADAELFASLSAAMDAGAISKQDWASFGSKLMDSITALKAMGRITTVADFGFALKEVVEGLR